MPTFFLKINARPLLFFLVVGGTSSIFPAWGANSAVDWRSLSANFAHYTKDPSDHNADKVCFLLPDKLGLGNSMGASRERQDAEDFIFAHLSALKKQVIKGKRSAIKLAFRLYTIADGEFAEDLDITLGKIICRNPRLFLQELKANRVFAPGLGGLLQNLGPDFVDQEKASALERQKRLNCLLKVHDPELQDVRDECVEVLQESPVE